MKQKMRRIIEYLLKIMAEIVLRRRDPFIIGITGSAGKSSAKEAIYTVLSEKFKDKIWKNEGNLNEEIGVPLSILGFKRVIRWYAWPIILIVCAIKVISYQFKVISYPKILVLELAANKPGDIKYLLSFIKPKVAVVTAIGLAHTETFGNLKNIINEKGYIVEILPKDAWAIFNVDDEEVKKMAARTKARVVYYHGASENSALEAAKAVGKIFNLTDNEMNGSFSHLKLLPHRLNKIKKFGVTIIDDTYNANPLSMARALDILEKEVLTKKNYRKIAVLGDMLELGEFSVKAHQDVAERAKETADLLITVGSNFAKVKSDYHFENSVSAQELVLKLCKVGDIILIKGSRGAKMEKIVEALLQSRN